VYRSGFFAFFALLLLALLLASPSHGQEITISETTWNGIKISYAQLKTAHQSLSASLENSQSQIINLERNLAAQWLDLNRAKSTQASLSSQLQTAQTQAALLETQLAASEIGLNAAMQSLQREKIKAYVWGGAVGLAVGFIIGITIGILGG